MLALFSDERIEQPREGNEPNWAIIEKIKEQYAPILEEAAA